MATYLELVKDLARESGTLDPASITSITGLQGRGAKMAQWIKQAYINIQNSRRDWGWLASDFTAPLLPDTAAYTPAALGITDFASWDQDRGWYSPLSIYDPDVGVSDEVELPQVSYEAWRSRYGRGDQTFDYQHRPTEYAISPRNELVFGSVPDKAYIVRGQYYASPQVLTNLDDIPAMPSRWHHLIVLEAHRLLLISDAAWPELQAVTMELVGLRHQLETDQLPEVRIP